jgi:DNA-binding transcriptional ArsR family regulator
MSNVLPLPAELWRICRVLANRNRLRMLALLQRSPGLTVTAVAGELKLGLPVASLSLRALETSGFVTSTRRGSRVQYLPRVAPDSDALRPLIEALHHALVGGDAAVEEVFRAATAFTHPRRIEIIRQLNDAPQEPDRLRVACKASSVAATRHLRKLRTRGVIVYNRRRIELVKSTRPLTAALTRLAIA